jgi:hypothetical protein
MDKVKIESILILLLGFFLFIAECLCFFGNICGLPSFALGNSILFFLLLAYSILRVHYPELSFEVKMALAWTIFAILTLFRFIACVANIDICEDRDKILSIICFVFYVAIVGLYVIQDWARRRMNNRGFQQMGNA